MDETFDAVEIGTRREFGSYEVTREEIVSFAQQYDPQPCHVDEQAARESMFGELVASGWHTAAMTVRVLVDDYINDSGAMGSPGVNALRFRNPVAPGDVLSVRAEHTDKEVWDDDRGLVYSDVTTTNQDDDAVLTMEAMALYPRT
jgi:acyl dehydratase